MACISPTHLSGVVATLVAGKEVGLEELAGMLAVWHLSCREGVDDVALQIVLPTR